MTRLEILFIGKAIRDTPLSATGRAALVKEITRVMKQRNPLFQEKAFKEIVSNADYKDHQCNYLLEELQ